MVNFGFNSFEEAYEYFNKPTKFENLNGIKEVSREVHNISENIKLVTIEKSDNSRTLIIFYASNKRWIYWCPTNEDFQALRNILEGYAFVDGMNEAVRWQDAKWQVVLR
ncbi:MAG: hypothetical protein QXH07_01865 [Thermoplasmata archaeon]